MLNKQHPLIIKNWQRLTLPHFTVVPSALVGLTSLFGKGRGGPHRHSHHKVFLQIHQIIFVKRRAPIGSIGSGGEPHRTSRPPIVTIKLACRNFSEGRS